MTMGGDFGGAKALGTGQPIEGGRKRPGAGRSRGYGGHKCPPTERKRRRELSRLNRDTHWREWRGERKKRKSPQRKKAPNKKRETAACGSACLRAAAPPSSLASLPLLPLPMAASPPHNPSSRLSLASPSPSSYGGCAATLSAPFSYSFFLPSPRLSRLLWAAAPPFPEW